MEKHITDEKTGISYTLQGDYYLPDLQLDPEDNVTYGRFGSMHLKYIKNHKSIFYSRLLMSGKINRYLAEIDMTAKERLDTIMKQMAKQQGVTEVLKATDQLKWVSMMNNIRHSAEEVVLKELIYV